MTAARPLDIKVVYDGRSRRGRSRPYARTSAPRRAATWILLGGVNIVAASLLCYVTAWQIDRGFIYEKIFCEYLAWKAPLPGVNPHDVATMLLPGLTAQPDGAPPAVSSPIEPLAFAGISATTIVGVAVYSWLMLAMVACFALALSGGAAFGRVGGRTLRLVGRILTGAALLGMVWAAYGVWVEFGMEYPPSRWRAGMGGLTVLSALLGLSIGGTPRRLTRLAGVMLLLLAVGSIAGLFIASQCGAVALQATLLQPFTLVFVAALALWGVVLLSAASRVGS